MTKKNNHIERTTGDRLEDLYNIASTIEEKIEEILEELGELVDVQRDGAYRRGNYTDYAGGNGY